MEHFSTFRLLVRPVPLATDSSSRLPRSLRRSPGRASPQRNPCVLPTAGRSEKQTNSNTTIRMSKNDSGTASPGRNHCGLPRSRTGDCRSRAEARIDSCIHIKGWGKHLTRNVPFVQCPSFCTINGAAVDVGENGLSLRGRDGRCAFRVGLSRNVRLLRILCSRHPIGTAAAAATASRKSPAARRAVPAAKREEDAGEYDYNFVSSGRGKSRKDAAVSAECETGQRTSASTSRKPPVRKREEKYPRKLVLKLCTRTLAS